MQTVCPACGYRRDSAESAPAWQCPSCGIAYAKVEPEAVFAGDVVCPSCRYQRSAADTNPHWQCPNCKIAYTKFGLEPEYPADTTCPRCYYTRQPADQGPHWQCPNCGADYGAGAESDTETAPGPAIAVPPVSAAPTIAAARSTWETPREAPASAVLPPDLPLRPILLVAALLTGLILVYVLAAYSCYAIAGVWLCCLVAIWLLLGIRRHGLYGDARRDPLQPESRGGGAPLPLVVELIVFAIIVLTFATGNGLFSQQCQPVERIEARSAAVPAGLASH